MPIPVRRFILEGLPIDRPPPFLTPYSDCVDGLLNVPEEPGEKGSRWVLSRGGVNVGLVLVPWEDAPYGAGEERR